MIVTSDDEWSKLAVSSSYRKLEELQSETRCWIIRQLHFTNVLLIFCSLHPTQEDDDDDGGDDDHLDHLI